VELSYFVKMAAPVSGRGEKSRVSGAGKKANWIFEGKGQKLRTVRNNSHLYSSGDRVGRRGGKKPTE